MGKIISGSKLATLFAAASLGWAAAHLFLIARNEHPYIKNSLLSLTAAKETDSLRWTETNISAIPETKNLSHNGLPASVIDDRFYYIDQDGRLVEETGIYNVGRSEDKKIQQLQATAIRTRTKYDFKRGLVETFEQDSVPQRLANENGTLSSIDHKARSSSNTTGFNDIPADILKKKQEIYEALIIDALENPAISISSLPASALKKATDLFNVQFRAEGGSIISEETIKNLDAMEARSIKLREQVAERLQRVDAVIKEEQQQKSGPASKPPESKPEPGH